MTFPHAPRLRLLPRQRSAVDTNDAPELLRLAFEQSPLGMTICSIPATPDHSCTVLVNDAFAQMLGRSVAELSAADTLGHHTHEDDRASDLAHLRSLLAGREQVVHWDKRYRHADGHVVWGRVSASALRGPDGQPRYLIAQIQDITDRREQEAQLLERAERDPLTGLLNRAAFDKHAHEQMVRCNRYGEHAELLVLDLDGLKQINDGYGHLAGDQALVAVADALRTRLRDGDVAARLGGDEFVVLLPHTGSDEAHVIADDITNIVATTRLPVAHDIALSVSIGATEITPGSPGLAPTLAEADRDMYATKRRRRTSGGGGIRVVLRRR